MKAILLSGGQGTRLREISGGLPKPMMPLLGKPLLEHIIVHLRQNGFRELCVTLCYEPDIIRRHFGDGGDYGVSITYREETVPLGTAGAAANCRDFVGDSSQVLIMSGDCACDFDLKALAQSHHSGVTIALATHGEPLPYGLVITDRSGRITGFLEKPTWERVVTDQVNTGIYVLSADVLDLIPKAQSYDFARDLFPRLLRENIPMRGVKAEGYWCDIGAPRAYYQCNLDALDGKLRLYGSGGHARRVLPCRDRARLMGSLSRALAEFGADFTDGLTVSDAGGRVHMAPLNDRSALVLEGDEEAVSRMMLLARRLDRSERAPDP